MRRRNFGIELSRALDLLETPTQAAGGANPIDQDPALRQQQQDAERNGQNKAQSADNQQQDQNKEQQQQDQNKEQQQKQQQIQQGTQLSTRMANFDKQIAQLQAKIQGGAAKPAEINQLNQLLTAKKAIQDQFMRLYGVNPTA